MTNDQMRCAACAAFLPVARHGAGKWIGGITAAALGRGLAKSWLGVALIAAAGVAAGAMVDAAAKPICGSCGVRAT